MTPHPYFVIWAYMARLLAFSLARFQPGRCGSHHHRNSQEVANEFSLIGIDRYQFVGKGIQTLSAIPSPVYSSYA